MSSENTESRINIEDLPQAERELTSKEGREVKGGDGAQLKLQGGVTPQAGRNTYRGTTTVDNG